MQANHDTHHTTDDRDAGSALAAAFDHAHHELIGTLYYITGDRDGAGDVLQEAFLKCWRHRDSLPKIDNLKAWIFRIAVNTARDHRKSAWNRKRRGLPDETPIPSRSLPPERELMKDEQLALLHHAVMQLRPEEQEVFLLRQNGELTYEAIAEVISIPIGTVKTRMRSAIRQLRESVGDKE